MPIAYRNSWRVVKVSMRNAVIGIMMPLVSMNPVVSHCTVLLGTSNWQILVVVATPEV